MQKCPELAIFDLDYTLTKRGTWGRFTWMNVKTRPHLWLPLLLSAGWTQFCYKQGKIPRKDVKLCMMYWAMRGKTRQQLESLADKFAQREIKKGLRPGGLERLRTHQRQGHQVMIASAAVDLLVRPIAKYLDIPHFVATDMSFDDNHYLQMEFSSDNCYGAEKLRRIKSFIHNSNMLESSANLYKSVTFYTDSYSDIDSLLWADIGVAVNPDQRLRADSLLRGFAIENWDKKRETGINRE